MFHFYQIRPNADALEQVCYLRASAYGWWNWSKSRREHLVISDLRYSTGRTVIAALAITAALAVALGYATSRLRLWLPAAFPEVASYPYVDALTTIMSFTVMWLMARKCVENWIYWIAVDVIDIGLCFVKDVRFVSLLYAILSVLAVKGLGNWRSTYIHTASSVLRDPTR